MTTFNVSKKEIEDATIEAIYWWNRTEFNYNKYFSQIEVICKNKKLRNFFNRHLFEVFLREYSIRRNLKQGYKNVDNFLVELIKEGFFRDVKKKNADVGIIDTISASLKRKGIVTNKQTKSLLSKIAFLVNPSVFTLYDTLTKASLWKIVREENKVKRKDLENYTNFHKNILELRAEIGKQKLFVHASDILSEFKGTNAFDYFNKNTKAFEMRVIDKLLWIKGQGKDGREINNEQYSKLLKLS